ncbi:MAG TPA: mechanosensitive ion channel family protein [Bryobacteraceae bacterium]|nr:mechanosensitive ion channel family protein [Bryobacteraceae bacterium]
MIRGVYAFLITAFLVALLFLLTRVHARMQRSIEALRARRYAIRVQASELVSTDRLTTALRLGLRVLRWVAVFLLVYIYVPLVLRFLPVADATMVEQLGEKMLKPALAARDAMANYLPNAVALLLIAVVTVELCRFSGFVFREIGAGRIRLHGFYADWASPTDKLVRAAIIGLAIVVAFPFLPGAESSALKGLTIFAGVLLSLGSTSMIANLMAGAILVYMRPFQLGDSVRIDNTEGDVIEKTLLVTRLRTIKNVVITIPNASVMKSHVINYSTSAQGLGLILNTAVTIGYDAPWRQVYQLLVDAALSTPRILQEPKPFVFQTTLNDFYVTYELNAYTREVARMADIYSALHENIQDRFNEAGLEILSPHYARLRDGNGTTVPPPYRPAAYQPEGFRVWQYNAGQARTAASGDPE